MRNIILLSTIGFLLSSTSFASQYERPEVKEYREYLNQKVKVNLPENYPYAQIEDSYRHIQEVSKFYPESDIYRFQRALMNYADFRDDDRRLNRMLKFENEEKEREFDKYNSIEEFNDEFYSFNGIFNRLIYMVRNLRFKNPKFPTDEKKVSYYQDEQFNIEENCYDFTQTSMGEMLKIRPYEDVCVKAKDIVNFTDHTYGNLALIGQEKASMLFVNSVSTVNGTVIVRNTSHDTTYYAYPLMDELVFIRLSEEEFTRNAQSIEELKEIEPHEMINFEDAQVPVVMDKNLAKLSDTKRLTYSKRERIQNAIPGLISQVYEREYVQEPTELEKYLIREQGMKSLYDDKIQ